MRFGYSAFEAIAAPRRKADEILTVAAIAEKPLQRGHLHPDIGVADRSARPDGRDQFVARDKTARAFRQIDQNRQFALAHANGKAALAQGAIGKVEDEGTKDNRTCEQIRRQRDVLSSHENAPSNGVSNPL